MSWLDGALFDSSLFDGALLKGALFNVALLESVLSGAGWPTQLRHPALLSLLLLLIPLIWWHHQRQGDGALTYSSLSHTTRFAHGRRFPWLGRGRGLWRLHLPFYLRIAALALLIIAFARPQRGLTWEQDLTEGIDIVVALDVSGSMAAEDFQPNNRLFVAKDVVQSFVSERAGGDRIGLVVFAGATLVKSPLTTDRGMLRQLIESVELDILPDGTAIGMALAAGAARLKDSAATSKVMVLVTDGVNNAGAIDPASAAAVAEGLGLRVYTIGVGTDGTVPMPVPMRDPRTGRVVMQRRMVEVEVDEELLRAIAGRTGGRYFQATDPESLRSIFDEIDELERTPIEVKRYVRFEEAFQPLAWTALILTLLPVLLATLGLTIQP